jgi:hypothetical protein
MCRRFSKLRISGPEQAGARATATKNLVGEALLVEEPVVLSLAVVPCAEKGIAEASNLVATLIGARE